MPSSLSRLLRADGAAAPDVHSIAWPALATAVLLGGAAYGIALGTFSASPMHTTFVAIKVPLLIVSSALLAMPAFLAVCATAGLGDDLRLALRSIVHGQATFALVLAALAPLTAFVIASGASYALVTVQAGLAFLTAALCAQVTLRRHDAPLHARHPRYRAARSVFGICHALVAIQLAWLLRPFVGEPGQPVQFLRDEPFGNAFVAAFGVLVQVLRGL